MLYRYATLCVVSVGAIVSSRECFSGDSRAAFDYLAIGCNDAGAATYLLLQGQSSLTLMGGIPLKAFGPLPEELKGEFDFVYLLRSRQPACYYFLFCREGFVVAKSAVEDGPFGNLVDVYRKEKQTGMHAVVRNNAMKDRIRWGKRAEVRSLRHADWGNNKLSVMQTSDLRCGLIPSGLAAAVPAQERRGAIVVLENGGKESFTDSLSAESFLLAPSLNTIEIIDTKSRDVLAKTWLGVFGSFVVSLPDHRGELHPHRFGAVRLRPGESIVAVLALSALDEGKEVKARVLLLGADSQNVREYQIESGTARVGD